MKNVEDIFTLAPMQQLMLMHSLRTQGSSTLVNQFRYRLRGALDHERLRAAWQATVARHQALRTAFIWEDVPHPLQVVREEVSLPFDVVDLTDHAERETALESIQADDRARDVDLRRAPLMRLTLIQLDHDDHVLLWCRHHLVLDLWSVEVLFEEVLAHYESPDRALPAPGRFRDYVAWIQQQDPTRAEAHWSSYLEALDGPSLLFTDGARRGEWSRAGQAVTTRSLGDTLDTLATVARANGLTTGTVLQGAIALAVAARTGRRDVVFGLTVSGRPQAVPDVERTLGSFINNLPVRVTLDDDATLLDVLAAIQRAQGERAPFEHVSPIAIQRASGVAPDQPLFDLLVLLQAPVATAPAAASVHVEAMDGPFDSAMPMTLAIESGEDTLVMTAVHDESLVSVATAQSVLDEVEHQLLGLLEAPGSRVGARLPAATAAPAATVRPAPAPSAPGDDAGEVLLDIWRRALGQPEIELDDDFFALGGTSVQAAFAFGEIERLLGHTMPLSTLFRAGSVRRMMEALELPPAPRSSLVSIQRLGSRPPVLAISGIGGHVLGLAHIARLLGREQPFYGLQSKGLDSDEAPLAQVEQIATEYLTESEPVRQGPFVLLGLCFGANVALEMAHQLARQGRRPDLLIVLDPVFDDGDQRAGPPGERAPRATLARFLVERASLYYRTFRDASPAERRRWLAEKGALWAGKLRQGDMLGDNRLELRARRVEAANLAAARSYRPSPYDGPVRALLTSRTDVAPEEDPRLHWLERLVQPGTPTERVPGADTGEALTQHAPFIADLVRAWIDDV